MHVLSMYGIALSCVCPLIQQAKQWQRDNERSIHPDAKITVHHISGILQTVRVTQYVAGGMLVDQLQTPWPANPMFPASIHTNLHPRITYYLHSTMYSSPCAGPWHTSHDIQKSHNHHIVLQLFALAQLTTSVVQKVQSCTLKAKHHQLLQEGMALFQ